MNIDGVPVPFNGMYDLLVPALRLADDHSIRRAQLALADMESMLLLWHADNPPLVPTREDPAAAGPRMQAALRAGHEPLLLALGIYLGVLAHASAQGQRFRLGDLHSGTWTASVARYFEAFGGYGYFFQGYVVLAAAHAPNTGYWQNVASRTKRNLDVGRYVLEPIALLETQAITLLISLVLSLPVIRGLVPQRLLPRFSGAVGALEGEIAAETVTATQITGFAMLAVELAKAVVEAVESGEMGFSHVILLLAMLPIKLLNQLLFVVGNALGILQMFESAHEAIKGVLFLGGLVEEADLNAWKLEMQDAATMDLDGTLNEDMPEAFTKSTPEVLSAYPHLLSQFSEQDQDAVLAVKLYERLLRLRDEGKIFGLESLDDRRSRTFEGRSSKNPFTVNDLGSAPHRYTYVVASDTLRGVTRETGFDRVVEYVQHGVKVDPALRLDDVMYRKQRRPDYTRAILQVDAVEAAALRENNGEFRPGWRAHLRQRVTQGRPVVVKYMELFSLDTNLNIYGDSPVAHAGKTKVTQIAVMDDLLSLGLAIEEKVGVRIRLILVDLYHLPAEAVEGIETARIRLRVTSKVRTELELVWWSDEPAGLDADVVERKGPSVEVGKSNQRKATIKRLIDQSKALDNLLQTLLRRRGK